jgi:hypothetical protein
MSSTPITACEGWWFDNGGPTRPYSPGLNLTQTICSPAGQRLVFRFNKNVTGLSSSDTLFAYDGNSSASPLIGKYISAGEYEHVVSTGSCITFRFQSDGINESNGWAATFSCTETPPQPEVFVSRNGTRVACSGIFTDDGGTSASYLTNQFDDYTFISNTPGAKLQFNFTQFSTEANTDRLLIYDGPNISSPLLGTYSGSNNPGLVSSTGSSLTFRWNSDGSAVSPGWIANMSCVGHQRAQSTYFAHLEIPKIPADCAPFSPNQRDAVNVAHISSSEPIWVRV